MRGEFVNVYFYKTDIFPCWIKKSLKNSYFYAKVNDNCKIREKFANVHLKKEQ